MHTILRLDLRLIDEHVGDVVVHRIDTMALRALQGLWTLAILERHLAHRANQDFQQIFLDHDGDIVRQTRLSALLR